MILLNYDPQPESVKLILNGVSYFVQTAPGLRLEGRKLTIANVEGTPPLLTLVQEDAPKGGVILKYQRAFSRE